MLAVAMSVCMVAVMVIGVVRAGSSPARVLLPVGLVFVMVCGGLLLAMWMPQDNSNSALWFGLPPRAAVVLYGVGILPLFLLPLAYAFTFSTLTLADADLERVHTALQDVPASLHGSTRPDKSGMQETR